MLLLLVQANNVQMITETNNNNKVEDATTETSDQINKEAETTIEIAIVVLMATRNLVTKIGTLKEINGVEVVEIGIIMVEEIKVRIVEIFIILKLIYSFIYLGYNQWNQNQAYGGSNTDDQNQQNWMAYYQVGFSHFFKYYFI